MYIDSMKVWLEKTRSLYIDSFQIDIKVRYPLLVMYDEKTGMDLSGYDDFNGGSASLIISPTNFWGGFYNGYNWIIGHEFGHIFNDLMYYKFPMGFYHEGMANFSGYLIEGGEHLDDQWKIDYVFNYYRDNHGREPTLEEFITNPHAGESGLEWGIDCYFFGFEFMRFLSNNEGYPKMKEFFNSGFDFDVFEMTYQEIETGYKDYLKQLNTERDHHEPKLINNNTMNVERGKSAIIQSSLLHSTDQDVTDNKLFYNLKTALNFGYLEKLNNPGMAVFRFTEEDIKNQQIRYVNDGTVATSDFFMFELTDKTFFLPLKQFNITLTPPTGISELERNFFDLQVYPNPVNSESQIIFTLSKPENVELTIFDLQGKKLSNISNKTLTAGYHEFPVGKYITKKGIYFLRLKTIDNATVLKLIVE